VGLSGFVVGVLSKNNNTHPRKRARVESGEDKWSGRETGVRGIFASHEGGQEFEIGFIKFGLQDLAPCFFDMDVH